MEEYLPEARTILDPFCGGGTTLVEAVRMGRNCVGFDLNPLAVAVSRAKLTRLQAEDVLVRLNDLSSAFVADDLNSVPDEIRMLYHPRTLAQLTFLRDELDHDHEIDQFLLGAILGILHGKWRRDGSSAYLSIDMPNTFSMSAGYVQRFIDRKGLTQQPIDVFGKLRNRVIWLLRDGPVVEDTFCKVFHADATSLPLALAGHDVPPIDGVVTSPPYLGVLRYGSFNWIRLWFLKQQAAAVDHRLDTTDSLDQYLSFLSSFLVSLSEVIEPDVRVVLVIGDVVEPSRHLQLANLVWEEISDVVPYEIIDCIADEFDVRGKTTRIWGEERKGRATPLDRYLVLRRTAEAVAGCS